MLRLWRMFQICQRGFPMPESLAEFLASSLLKNANKYGTFGRWTRAMAQAQEESQMTTWIKRNKNERPFAAGALAFIQDEARYYGCHYGMRGTLDWAKDQFYAGYDTAERDYHNKPIQTPIPHEGCAWQR